MEDRAGDQYGGIRSRTGSVSWAWQRLELRCSGIRFTGGRLALDKDKRGGLAHVCDSRTCLEALVEDSAGGEHGGVRKRDGSDTSCKREWRS